MYKSFIACRSTLNCTLLDGYRRRDIHTEYAADGIDRGLLLNVE